MNKVWKTAMLEGKEAFFNCPLEHLETAYVSKLCPYPQGQARKDWFWGFWIAHHNENKVIPKPAPETRSEYIFLYPTRNGPKPKKPKPPKHPKPPKPPKPIIKSIKMTPLASAVVVKDVLPWELAKLLLNIPKKTLDSHP